MASKKHKSILFDFNCFVCFSQSYIDDVFFTWNGSISTLQTYLRNLNDKHQNIKLVYKYGISVTFLDVSITNENGILHTSVYHKDAAEPYIAPFTSDHPPHLFRNVINVALNRAVHYSSTFKTFNNDRRYVRLKLLYNRHSSSFFRISIYLESLQILSKHRYPSKYIDSVFRKFFAKQKMT